MGGVSPLNSLLVKARSYATEGSRFKDDYMISIGVYANFLDHQKKEAESFSKMTIEYSKESQLNREAIPYLAGWHWKKI